MCHESARAESVYYDRDWGGKDRHNFGGDCRIMEPIAPIADCAIYCSEVFRTSSPTCV